MGEDAHTLFGGHQTRKGLERAKHMNQSFTTFMEINNI